MKLEKWKVINKTSNPYYTNIDSFQMIYKQHKLYTSKYITKFILELRKFK